MPSPAPHYNFAVQPVVTHRDEWWHRKKTHYQAPHKSEYRDVWLPKNSAVGLLIGLMACGAGFGIIWHLWWLVGLLALGIIVIIIIRTTKDDTEYLLTAEELLKEDRRAKGMAV